MDAKSLRRYLDMDNLIYIESDNGLPAWGGVLDVDTDWNEDGTITYSAYSGEYLLKFRRSPLNQLFKESSAGALFEKFIAEANRNEDLLIRVGDIWKGGGPAEDTMDGKSFYDHARALSKNRGHDWSIDPFIDPVSHRLYFTANYYEQAGVVRTRPLKEGFNIEKKGRPLRVERSVINNLLGIGAGSDDSRPTWIAEDATSRRVYRLREGTEDFSGNTDPATVRANTEARLKIISKNRNVYNIEALNVEDTFANIRKGDILPLLGFTFGWLGDEQVGTDTYVRAKKMKMDDATETMEITPDEDFFFSGSQ
jgi:hypothetical protein